MKKPKITIVGGGLAGLSAGLNLSRKGFPVQLFEKKTFPFHRVCGEYVSNEVLPYLKELGINPFHYGASRINRLEVSSVQGRMLQQDLDLGGFGISRYTLDQILYSALLESGAELITGVKVNSIDFIDPEFHVKDDQGRVYRSDYVLGAFGKRSNLDQVMQRPFFKKRSPYLGVKYHLKFDLDEDKIQLHNFQNGYAGISAVEDHIFCFCYLSRTSNLKKYGTLDKMEEAVLKKNPYLKNILENGEFLWNKPQVIHEISFEPKELVFNHILMCGDSAGLISPLCGNGMAIAIHSGKILAETLASKGEVHSRMETRLALENTYSEAWKKQFHTRLWAGRQIQKLFGGDFLTHQVLGFLNAFPSLTTQLIQSTHGEVF